MTVEGPDIDNWESAAIDRGNWGSIVKTGMEREKIEERHNRLSGGITERRDLPKLYFLHSRLCMSAVDEVEIVTPE